MCESIIKYVKKGSKNMRKTVNIEDKNYERIRALASNQKMTITAIINMAVEKYITSHVLNEAFNDIMLKSLQNITVGDKNNK